MLINIFKFILPIFLIINLTSCGSIKRLTAETRDANTYGSDELGKVADVLEGKILVMRQITIAGSKGIGALAGGALGGLAGSTVNNAPNDQKAAATIAAVAGSALGSMLEEAITEKEAWEFVIALKNGGAKSFVQNTNQDLKVGDEVYIIQSSGQVRISRK
jgi:outer membrane lipoprotein SlyB